MQTRVLRVFGHKKNTMTEALCRVRHKSLSNTPHYNHHYYNTKQQRLNNEEFSFKSVKHHDLFAWQTQKAGSTQLQSVHTSAHAMLSILIIVRLNVYLIKPWIYIPHDNCTIIYTHRLNCSFRSQISRDMVVSVRRDSSNIAVGCVTIDPTLYPTNIPTNTPFTQI